MAAVHAYHCLAFAQVGVLEAGELCIHCCEALRVLQTLPFQLLAPVAEAVICGTNNVWHQHRGRGSAQGCSACRCWRMKRNPPALVWLSRAWHAASQCTHRCLYLSSFVLVLACSSSRCWTTADSSWLRAFCCSLAASASRSWAVSCMHAIEPDSGQSRTWLCIQAVVKHVAHTCC